MIEQKLRLYPTPLEMVQEYATKANQQKDIDMAISLVYEEWNEVTTARNSEELLKELADLVYVIYGYANTRGWDLDEALYRVHSNNLNRMTQDDGTIKYREDGKVIKNPNTPKVELGDLL